MCEISLEPQNTCAKFTYIFGPSLWRVWISRSKAKVTRDKVPPHWKCIVTHSQQITSRSSRWDHSVAAGGDGSVIYVPACMRFMFSKTSLASNSMLVLIDCLYGMLFYIVLPYIGLPWVRSSLQCSRVAKPLMRSRKLRCKSNTVLLCHHGQYVLAVKISLDLLKGLRSYGGFKLMVSGFCQIFSGP